MGITAHAAKIIVRVVGLRQHARDAHIDSFLFVVLAGRPSGYGASCLSLLRCCVRFLDAVALQAILHGFEGLLPSFLPWQREGRADVDFLRREFGHMTVPVSLGRYYYHSTPTTAAVGSVCTAHAMFPFLLCTSILCKV